MVVIRKGLTVMRKQIYLCSGLLLAFILAACGSPGVDGRVPIETASSTFSQKPEETVSASENPHLRVLQVL